MNFLNTTRTLTAMAALSLATLAQATVVSADFEVDLSGWSERDPAAPTGEIVFDPLNAANKVLTFQRNGSNGSLFSRGAATSTSGWYTLSFDYLGLQGKGGTAGDLGGYIGVVPMQGHWNLEWMAGTGTQVTPLNLIDDGIWRNYSITFLSRWNSLSVAVQDWDDSSRLAQATHDAFFDNISLRAASVPEPTSLALVGLALLAVGATAKRKAGVQG